MNEFLLWYQNIPSNVSPEIISIGFFSLRWYGMGYILALITSIILGKYLVRKNQVNFPLTTEEVEKLGLYIILVAVIGGRLGYVLFYQPGYYLAHPLEAILPFRFANGIQFVGFSGISYHGSLAAILIMFFFFARKKGVTFYHISDFCAVVSPLGYTFGRLGNFMNGELYGRVTDVPWGMYFLDENGIPFESLRHPSQLYEAFFEGIVLFAIVWSIRNRVPYMVTSGVYMVGYASARSFVEFFRQPDAIFRNPGDELGTVLWLFTMGQVLSFVMFVAGSYMIYQGYKRARLHPHKAEHHAGVTATGPAPPPKKKKKKHR